mgnify:CR=1 FL=1
MKLLKTCPILVGIVAVCTILSIVSFACEKTVYSEYAQMLDLGKEPHFVILFKGLSDGIYPWSRVDNEPADNYEGIAEDEPVSENTDSGSYSDGYVSENDVVSGGLVSENDSLPNVSENNAVSDNSVSDNDADRTYEFTEVTDDYFTDALFIGDSRTVGLSEYCEPLDERATFYAKISLTIYGVLEKEFIKTEDAKISIEQALAENQFGKIYIMLGLNEIGTGTAETFAAEYENVVNRIRELQPDAIIYIQGIMHVTEKKSSGDKYFNNENINIRNEAISELADDKNIFYIDMNEAVDDENGNLLQELTFDDVHLKASSYQRWYDYLLAHGIVK